MNGVITAIVPYIVPTIIVVLGYAIHQTATYIPAQQRAYISMFADMAVRMVESQFASYTEAQKEAAALSAIKDLFKAFNLPVPNDTILTSIIVAAFQALTSSTTTLQGGKSS
jgi:flagellar biosynthesis protein FliQ